MNQLVNQLDMFKALSNDTRLQIITWLKDPEAHFPQQEGGNKRDIGVCVSDIQKKAGLSQSTVSQYLSSLEKAGLITAARVGQWTYYKRNEKNIAILADFIRSKL